MTCHPGSRRGRRLFILAALAGGLAAASASALLRPEEAEANAALAKSLALPLALAGNDAASLAAAAALAEAQGETARALSLYRGSEEAAADCLVAVRLAALGEGVGCSGIPAASLPAAANDAGRASGARIVGRRPEESSSAFFAAVTVAAVQAVAASGVPEVRTTADRFRIEAGVVLEGTWYRSDRVLVVARPGTGGAAAAQGALDRLALLRPEHVVLAPAAPASFGRPAALAAGPALRRHVDERGFELDVPADWAAPRAEGERVVFEAEGVIVAAACRSEERGAARRNPLARRRPAKGDEDEGALLGPGVEVTDLQGRVTEGDDTATPVVVRFADGRRWEGLRRVTALRGTSCAIVATWEGDGAREARAVVGSFGMKAAVGPATK